MSGGSPDPTPTARVPVPTEDGSPTLYSPEYEEYFHNLSGAFLESIERYVVPCRVVERAREQGELSILDVGFGLGFNLAWAWLLLLEEAPEIPVRIVSLEKDPIDAATWESLSEGFRSDPRFRNPGGEERRERVLRGVSELLARGSHTAGPVRLKLRVGRAEDTIERVDEGFDAVFLDPFSPGRNPELWTPEFLTAVARRARPGAILSTYSSAVRVRVALLRAGWTIGAGPRVGRKSSGTLASIGEVDPPVPPLTPRVRRRLERRAREVETE